MSYGLDTAAINKGLKFRAGKLFKYVIFFRSNSLLVKHEIKTPSEASCPTALLPIKTKNAHISSSGYYGVIWNFPKFPFFSDANKKTTKEKKSANS